MRFRADQRLRRQRDFRTARERGRRVDCGGFTLWYVKRAADEPVLPARSGAPSSTLGIVPDASGTIPPRARVGVVASTASVGGAVRRNRAKRRLRAIFRLHQHLVPSDVDLLLVARNSVNRVEYSELERKFVETCRRLFPASP